MKTCVIYANCQADGLELFLRRAGFPYEIKSFKNYQMLLKEQSIADLVEAAKKCDVFLYHHTPEEKYGEHSSEYFIRAVIPKHAVHAGIPYAYNAGMFPMLGYGGGTYQCERVVESLKGRELKAVLAEYEGGIFDFKLDERFEECIRIQKEREATLEIKLTDWMNQNRNQRLFLNENHPTSVVFTEMARRVFIQIEGRDPGPIHYYGFNDANLPCELPVSEYIIHHYGWKEKAHWTAHAHYRALLALGWKEGNP